MLYRTGVTLASSYIVNTSSPCGVDISDNLINTNNNKYNVTVNFRRTEAAVLAC